MTNKLGIYIHWPYCTHICPYCDFNIYRARGHDHAPLINAIIQEIEYYKAERELVSIYFGGGTPSLLLPNEIENILNAVSKNFKVSCETEITIEANPLFAETEKFNDFKAVGINRLSLGVQSFYATGLKDLGRFHTIEDSFKATELAAKIFDKASIDLIYARQNQTLEEWEAELKIATNSGISHISPYQLTFEPNTAFDRKLKRGQIKPPSDDIAADMYEATQDILSEFGFDNYEISNHAKSSNQSIHNKLYWQSQDFIGIGPGSHARIGNAENRKSIINIARPDEYIDMVNKNGHGAKTTETLTISEYREEYYLMGLRLKEGIDENSLFAPLNQERIIEFKALGLMENTKKHALTNKGRALSNYIIAELLD